MVNAGSTETVRLINLIPAATPQQVSLFDDMKKLKKRELLDETIEGIRLRFGKRSVHAASLMGDLKMPGRGVHEVICRGLCMIEEMDTVYPDENIETADIKTMPGKNVSVF